MVVKFKLTTTLHACLPFFQASLPLLSTGNQGGTGMTEFLTFPRRELLSAEPQMQR